MTLTNLPKKKIQAAILKIDRTLNLLLANQWPDIPWQYDNAFQGLSELEDLGMYPIGSAVLKDEIERRKPSVIKEIEGR